MTRPAACQRKISAVVAAAHVPSFLLTDEGDVPILPQSDIGVYSDVCFESTLFVAGFACLPWLWAVNVWMFWPDFKHGDPIVKACKHDGGSS